METLLKATTMFPVTILIFISSGYFVQCSRSYSPPELSIKVYEPEGVKITLPVTPGDQLFAFNGNINNPIAQNEEGDIDGIVTKKSKRKWVIWNKTAKVKVGDKIHYWITVYNSNRVYFQSGIFEIKDTVSDEVLIQGTTPTPCVVKSDPATTCERIVVNLTQTTFQLQEELDDVKATYKILNALVEKDSKLSKNLSLQGLVVDDGSVQMIVQAIVNDKLHLSHTVENVRNVNGQVEFEVENLATKLEILKVAEEKLKNSRYKITC